MNQSIQLPNPKVKVSRLGMRIIDCQHGPVQMLGHVQTGRFMVSNGLREQILAGVCLQWWNLQWERILIR